MKLFFLVLFFISVSVFISSMLIVSPYSIYLSAGSIQLGIFSLAMFFIWEKNLSTTLKSIGFPGNLKKNMMYSAIGLFAIFATLFVVNYLSLYFGFNDQEKVLEKVADLPTAILVVAVLVAPIGEELFFRAFLLTRIANWIAPWAGILISSLIFGLVHFSYGSIMELVGVTLIGIILAIIYLRAKSITPCLAIHMIYNLLAVIVMRFLL